MRGFMVNRGWAVIFGVLALLVLGGELLSSLPSFSSSAAVAQEADPAAPEETAKPAEDATVDPYATIIGQGRRDTRAALVDATFLEARNHVPRLPLRPARIPENSVGHRCALLFSPAFRCRVG